MSLLAAKKKLLMAQKKGLRVQEVFNTSLWTGTGAARTITTGINSGEGSLVWTKNRVRTSGYLHNLQDTIRGTSSQLDTASSSVATNYTNQMTAFSASGYSLSSGACVNQADDTYVGWQFRRAPKFFDIVQYTGNNANRVISHALGGTPGLILIKSTNDEMPWIVYHRSLKSLIGSSNGYLVLNSTSTYATSAAAWNGSDPTDSVFPLGTLGSVNAADGHLYIAYLFAHDPASEGVIQCGSYVGNGSPTGPVVNLGWRPQYLMIKSATTAGDWLIFDTSRMPGGAEYVLRANSGVAEENFGNVITFGPDGFSITNGFDGFNGSGQTYVYMAIREAA